MSSSEPAEAGYREGVYFPRSLKQPDPPERDNPSAGHRHGRLATTLLGADARTVTEPLCWFSRSRVTLEDVKDFVRNPQGAPCLERKAEAFLQQRACAGEERPSGGGHT